jgi:hypothetical protein
MTDDETKFNGYFRVLQYAFSMLLAKVACRVVHKSKIPVGGKQ